MSSRDDRRRRDRSRERDKGRDSRDRDRDSYSRREKSRERERQRDYRKDKPPRSRSRSPRREDNSRYDSERHRDAYRDRKDDRRNDDRVRRSEPERSGLNNASAPKLPHAVPEKKSDIVGKPVQLDSDVQGFEEGEEQESMQEIDPETEAMNAMMGFGGFGTTKGKEISGNQEGAVFVKKQRTWRQYMNRRGGFNRPLDKIK